MHHSITCPYEGVEIVGLFIPEALPRAEINCPYGTCA